MNWEVAVVDTKQLWLQYEKCTEKNKNCDPSVANLISEIKNYIEEIEESQTKIFEAEQEIKTIEDEQGRRTTLSTCNAVPGASSALHDEDDKEERSILQDKIDAYNAESEEAEASTRKLKTQVEEIVRDIERYQIIIAKGVSWTTEQERERDEILENIAKEKESLNAIQNELDSTRQQITDYENRIGNIEKQRDDVASDLSRVREKIEATNQKTLEKRKELIEVQSLIEVLTLRCQETQEKFNERSEMLNKTSKDEKKIKREIKEAQSDLEQLRRETNSLDKEILKVSKELEMQHHKNVVAEEENTTKQSLIKQKMKDVKSIAQETANIVAKKGMISEMISEIEIERLRYDQTEKDLKLKLKKIEDIELKTLFREIESQKQQLERLEREKDTIERKKNVTDKSSALAKNIIASNESTLINLQNEAHGLRGIVMESQKKIKELNHRIETQNRNIVKATNKKQAALDTLRILENEIQNSLKQVANAESICQQNQELCEAVKDEMNAQSMTLTTNKEQLDLKRRELKVIISEMNRLRIEISRTESAVITEHYNHHHVIQEQKVLMSTLQGLKKQETHLQVTMENNQKEISKLEQRIDEQQKENDKQKKEYSSLSQHRDTLNSLLSQKNDEAEKIREKIKTQEIMLNQAQLEFSKVIQCMEKQIKRLKHLIPLKHKYSELILVKNGLISETRALENDIEREQIKKSALKEDLHRPFNIHRWRTLEHLNPDKFQKIKDIQRLQKQVISSTERVSDKGATIRHLERECMELKQFVENFPPLEEVQEQLQLSKGSLSEKQRQLKELELDIELYRRRTSDLKREIKNLEKEQKDLEEHWVSEGEADESALSSNFK